MNLYGGCADCWTNAAEHYGNRDGTARLHPSTYYACSTSA
jgi:hypothetical protein